MSSTRTLKKWWQIWKKEPPSPAEDAPSSDRVPETPPVRTISLDQPAERSWFRQAFLDFVGKDKFEKFIRALKDSAAPKGRLMYWQEELLSRFGKERGISCPGSLSQMTKVFEADINEMSKVTNDATQLPQPARKTGTRYCQRIQREVVIRHEMGIFICEWSAGYKPTMCTEICVHSEAVQIAAMRASKSPAALGAKEIMRRKNEWDKSGA